MRSSKKEEDELPRLRESDLEKASRIYKVKTGVSEALPRLKECELEKVSRVYKAKNRAGCDGFHRKVSLDLTRGEVVEFLEKVEQSGKWPQQACTTMFFLIPTNVTSERRIALMPTMIR